MTDADTDCLGQCAGCALADDQCCAGQVCEYIWGDTVCMPDPPPDTTACPIAEPVDGSPCDKVGLLCSYGFMTTCYCTCASWQCAY